MFDPTPGSVGHVHEAVETADVHESAEVGDPADDAVDLTSDHQGVPLLLLTGSGLLQKHLLDGGHDALALLVDLQDLNLDGLAHVLAEILDIFGGNVRSGDEGADTALHLGDQTALDDFLHHCLEGLALGLLGHEIVPELLALDVLPGKKHVALAVVHLDDLHIDLLAFLHVDLGFGIGGELGPGDVAVGLVAHVDQDFTVGDADDGTGDDLAGTDPADGAVDGLLEVLRGVLHGRDGFLHFLSHGLHGLFCLSDRLLGDLLDGFLCLFDDFFSLLLGFLCLFDDFFSLLLGSDNGFFGRDYSFFNGLFSGFGDNLGGSFRFIGFDRRLFEFAHSLYNLPNHGVWRRCACDQSYYIIQFE